MNEKTSTFRSYLPILKRFFIVAIPLATWETATRVTYLRLDMFEGPTDYSHSAASPWDAMFGTQEWGSSSLDKTFWNYPYDLAHGFQVIATHVFAATALAVITFATFVIYMFFMYVLRGASYFNDEHEENDEYDMVSCTDRRCQCRLHLREEFIDGEWQSVCVNQECTCGYHKCDSFVDGKWQ